MAITIQELQAKTARKGLPRFKSGQTVRVYEHIREGNKERTQVFEGLVIATGGQGSGKTITVRKIIGGIGVEKVFSISSPIIEKIELIKEAKTRRSKIYFMRQRSGKSARLKEKFLTEKDLAQMVYKEASEEDIEEAKKAEEDEKENIEEKTEKAVEEKVEEKAEEKVEEKTEEKKEDKAE